MLKKAGVIFLMLILSLQLAACSGSEEDNTLRIYGLYMDHNVDPYIKSYQKKNPDVYISIEEGIAGDSSGMGDEGASAALKKLNTELLAGDGPDVILMDDINAEKYIEAGLLADITDIAEENENLTEGIVESSRYKDGKIYTMPAACVLMADTVRTGKEADFSSARDFADSLKAQGLHNSLSYSNEAGLWYRREIDPLIRKEGKISRERLQEFFTALGDFADYQPGTFTWRAYFMQSQLSVNPLKNYYGIVHGQEFFEEEGLHRVDATSDYLGHFLELQEMYHYRQKGEFTADYWKNEEGYYYIPMLNLAINKHSKKKGLAEDFVRYLLSDEGQQIARENHYLPVSSKATLDEMNQFRNPETFYTGEPDNMKAEQVSGFTDEIIGEVEEVFEHLNQPLAVDADLMEIVMHNAMAYINGHVSLDEALDNAMNKLDIYLAE